MFAVRGVLSLSLSLSALSSITIALLGITVVSGTILTSTPASADNDTVIDEVNITVPTACTMTGTGTNSHNAIINLGTSNSAIGETTIKAYCNDSAGFAIYAIGYTDDTDGKNVLTNSTLGSTYDIATGTATSGDTSNWAMKLFTITSPTPTYPITIESDTEGSFASFHTVPDDYTLVAKRTEGTDVGTGAEGSTLKSTYQAYISQTQPAGTYTGQVKYTLVHPNNAPAPTKPIDYTEEINCPAGYICYSPASNNTFGTMNVQDVGTYANDSESVIGYQPVASNTTKTLIAPNFKNLGFGFAGWNTEIDGTGTTYGPNEDITTPDLSEEGLALYAEWLPSAGNMQGWTGCSTMSANQVTALTDTRDNNVYAIAKLADGNCWMIENLRLDNAMTGTISSSNTNNPVSTFTTLPNSTDTWCSSSDSVCIDQALINNNNINIGGTNSSGERLAPSPSLGSNQYQWYGYGNYYSWYTATAGNGTYSSVSVDTMGDICPNGWSLPTSSAGGNDRQFPALVNAVSNNDFEIAVVAVRTYPNNFVYSIGGAGFYSSRTSTGENGSIHGLGFIQGSNQIYYGVDRYGLNIGKTAMNSVRCLFKINYEPSP